MSDQILKRWTVSVVAPAAGPLQYARADRPLESAAATFAEVSPVEHLLLSVAGCFALSCKAVLVRRKLPEAAIEVVVTGTKAIGGLSRLGQIEVSAVFDASISPSDARMLTEEAGALCTVSNSIAAAPPIRYLATVTSAR